MHNDAKSLLRARNQFLTSGTLEQGAVGEVIERSWRRCLDSGMDAASPPVPDLLTQHEIEHARELHHQLLTHARPEMDTLNEQIAHTRSMVILTDPNGVILHSLGDRNFLSAAQRVSLSPGSSWHEAHRGTNAIGTALVEHQPTTVQGAEHFIERHHILSCSAVPIFGTDNRPAGTLDVSNDNLLPQQHTLALVKMAAQMIENRLFRSSHSHDIALHFHARPEFIGTLWEGIAMFSGNGRLVALNRSGQFQFGLAPDGQQPDFDSLFDLPLRSALTHAGNSKGVIFPLRLGNGARLYARIELATPAQAAARSAPSTARTARRNCAATLDMLDSGDARIAAAITQVRKVLDRNIPILIEGETGVGKELFARAIHEASARRDGPWIAVNCAALPEGLIESELFGYEEGAFTGARRKGSPGKLEQANGGTLFLDEIGDMPLSLQARLLRVLQERSVTPLGSSQAKPLDFALISATNQQLRDKVRQGEFRSDLYYRLNGLSVTLPALRQRADLLALVQMLLQIENEPDKEIAAEVMALFGQHPWPGNIRQLHNVVRTALALSSGEHLTRAHLPQDFLEELSAVAPAVAASLEDRTTDAVRDAMATHGGNVSAAARQLGISRNTLYRKLKVLGLA